MLKKLPIGMENFKQICEEDFYYVDKTGLLIDLLNQRGEVNLFTRPRRFGKSLNMNMMKCFFEYGCDSQLFDGLQVSENKELCDEFMGQFPVISISLKDVSGDTSKSVYRLLSAEIMREVRRFQFLLESERLTNIDKESYRKLITIDQKDSMIDDMIFIDSLRMLSELLEKHYEKRVIVLIDEYDVPLDKAATCGCYEDVIAGIRSLLSKVLKSNEHLQFAVLTGCLRISKESVFTGLNNMQIFSITNTRFAKYFGFTHREVREMLDYFGQLDALERIKSWYDGYQFGLKDVYCPWDVVCYINELLANPSAKPKAYWMNTSSNDMIKHFVSMAKMTTKKEIERLIAGEVIEKEIQEELTYQEIYQSIDNLWSILFTTGYLTGEPSKDDNYYLLRIPNLEIREIFTRQIYQWFFETVRKDGQMLERFCEAFKTGNASAMEEQFTSYLKKTISIRDTFVKKEMKENFYHGILLGLLSYKEDWDVTSNRESGDGYSDIMIRMEEEEIGIIIEVKYPDGGDLEEGCKKALEQIDEKHYIDQLLEDGMTKIIKVGIACEKKRCKVVCERGC